MRDFWEQVLQKGMVNTALKQQKVDPPLFCGKVLEMAKLPQKPSLSPIFAYYRETVRNPKGLRKCLRS